MPDPDGGDALREPPGARDPHETPEHRLKRLRLRSWRRGTREMDMLLGPFAEAELGALPPAGLAQYEALLSENDHDLYLWLSRREDLPERYGAIVRRIAAFHGIG